MDIEQMAREKIVKEVMDEMYESGCEEPSIFELRQVASRMAKAMQQEWVSERFRSKEPIDHQCDKCEMYVPEADYNYANNLCTVCDSLPQPPREAE